MKKRMKVYFTSFCLALGALLASPWARAEAEADTLFADGPVRTLRLEVSAQGMNALRQSGRKNAGGGAESRPVVAATVREGDRVYPNVALHLKGSFGSFRPVTSKPGLTLKFDKTEKDQRFHGLAKLSLNNSVQDPSYITDKLCRELYLKAGVPAPRITYAVVELNGRRLGLYLLVEGWDRKFLKQHFPNADGNLYDPPQRFDIDQQLDVVTGKKPEDRSELDTLVEACAESDLERRWERLKECLDMDRFITLLACDTMVWNWDGYGLFKNNFRVFNDLAKHRVVFMPHGMDQMFWQPDGPIATGRDGLVARAVLQTEAGRGQYLARFRQLRAELYDVAAISNRVNELAARIRPEIIKDGFMAGIQHNRAVTRLNRQIAQRAASIDQQLESWSHSRKIAVGETIPLSGWEAITASGEPILDQTAEGGLLHIQGQPGAAGAWGTTLWLEEGTYVLQGRVKAAGIVSTRNDALRGAGLRVFSHRKRSAGLRWSWFPFDESRDFERRGEMATSKSGGKRLVGTADWTVVNYEFQLRQPLADLQILCELYASAGEVWFDPNSLKLTRKTGVCP